MGRIPRLPKSPFSNPVASATRLGSAGLRGGTNRISGCLLAGTDKTACEKLLSAALRPDPACLIRSGVLRA